MSEFEPRTYRGLGAIDNGIQLNTGALYAPPGARYHQLINLPFGKPGTAKVIDHSAQIPDEYVLVNIIKEHPKEGSYVGKRISPVRPRSGRWINKEIYHHTHEDRPGVFQVEYYPGNPETIISVKVTGGLQE